MCVCVRVRLLLFLVQAETDVERRAVDPSERLEEQPKRVRNDRVPLGRWRGGVRLGVP